MQMYLLGKAVEVSVKPDKRPLAVTQHLCSAIHVQQL